MQTFEDFKLSLRVDHFRNFGKVKSSIFFKLFNRKYKFLFLLRLCHFIYYRRTKHVIVKVIYRVFLFFYNRAQEHFGVEIEPWTKIGKGLFLPHLNGIVLNPNVVIGDNCTILQQVTIGNNGFKGLNDLAVIGDNVQIGAGAKIIGPCTIGSNITIGANAVVTKDILDNQVVGGIPASLLSNKVSKIHNQYLGE
ncbi:serine acetyltransferase [Psychromonas aquimarina]|uniref:serine acetyltransferase n=1 Tax=Psychromonas aquimarina TaxID=444919 RepID=UPI000409428B|nr:serine acetyltransferase [Psychromonas aquimarina]